jgi:hypothetical protein
LEKGPQMSKNLEDAAERHEKEAKKVDAEADRAEAAAAQMKKFQDTLEKRAGNLGSLDDQYHAANPQRGPASVADYSNVSASHEDAAASSGKPDAETSKLGADTIAANGAKISPTTGAGVDGQNANVSGTGASSLRDQLRDSLATGKAGGKGGGEPKSAFDDIFAGAKDRKNADGSSRSDIAMGGGGEVGPGGANGFSMSGSDTDRAVKGLMGNLNGDAQGADAAVFGNIDQTIFARMSKYLTKAQVDKRITSLK